MPLVSDFTSHEEGQDGGQEFLILGPIWNLSSVGVLARHLGTLRVSTICHKRKALALPRWRS